MVNETRFWQVLRPRGIKWKLGIWLCGGGCAQEQHKNRGPVYRVAPIPVSNKGDGPLGRDRSPVIEYKITLKFLKKRRFSQGGWREDSDNTFSGAIQILLSKKSMVCYSVRLVAMVSHKITKHTENVCVCVVLKTIWEGIFLCCSVAPDD